MKTRLIIIDGHSTVGKSSISKSVYDQLKGKHQTVWLHEECTGHPIREEEFKAGNLCTWEGMEKNRVEMLQSWKKLQKKIEKEEKIYIMEGCFLHQIDRYLISSIWTEKEISGYYAEIVEILRPLQPLYVFLWRKDLRESFQLAFHARGSWWKNLILNEPEPVGYFQSHPYTGEESIYDSILFEQEQMDAVFQSLPADKVKLETSEETWNIYTETIMKAMGESYVDKRRVQVNPLPFAGTYRSQKGHTWRISYDAKKGLLYSSLFWPYMPMEIIKENVLELISFPVTLHFGENHSSFIVQGDYDWDLNGLVFHRDTLHP